MDGKKINNPSSSPCRPALILSRQEVKTNLQQQIDKGKGLLNITISSQHDLNAAEASLEKWKKYTLTWLAQLIEDCSELADEFDSAASCRVAYIRFDEPSLFEKVSDYKNYVQDYINALESIHERVELFPSQINANAANKPSTQSAFAVESRNIFIVHGHDEAARQAVARFLEKLNLTPIILHEQANAGKTIIEKFEQHALNVNFAIILLTPDDVGGVDEQDNSLKNRARQNVILELGYFIGRLGRERVCALNKGVEELPSDILGVAYISLEDSESWKLQVAKELKQAGFNIDCNHLL